MKTNRIFCEAANVFQGQNN